MLEAVIELVMRLEPAVGVLNAPLQGLMIYMLWRIERRVFGLEMLWGVTKGRIDAAERGMDRS